MPDWVLWLLAAAVLAVGEVFTLGFLLGPIAIAAVLAAAAAGLGAAIEVQVATFIVAAIGSLLFIRPVVRRHMRTPPSLKTGTAALVGRHATVVDRVHRDGGSVKIGGEVWTARPFDEDETIEPGARVDVMKIEGATALVAE